MIILDSTTRKLQVVLGGAVTTNQLNVVASYVDITTTTFVPGDQNANTNSGTAVDIVAAPAASTQRQVKYLSVYNADTASATVTVRYNDGGTLYPLVVVALASGSTLEYIDAQGWQVLTSSGASPAAGTLPDPVTAAHGGTGLTTLTAHGVLVGEGTSNVAFAGPSSATGIPLVSKGAAADPAFDTAAVTGGGTGATSFTAHGILLGQGTSPVTATAQMTNGQLLVGQSGGDPTPTTMSGDATLSSGGALTLATVATAGTYGQVTVNAKGLATAGATCDVSHGGTGATSLTAHSLLVGEGTSAVTALGAATNGQIPIGSTGADPVLATITAGTNITVTNGAGSITIAASGGGGGTVIPSTNDFRLTLASGTPVPSGDQTAKSVVYLTPFRGQYIATYDSSAWAYHSSAEISLTLSALTSGKNYDVFAYNNSGTLTLELSSAWTNDTTRADALAQQDGVWVKSADHSRRYVGTVRTTGTTTTEDSAANRLVFNAANRVPRRLYVADTTTTWSYASTTWRQARGQSSNQVAVVVGLAEALVRLRAMHYYSVTASGTDGLTDIGVDWTSGAGTGDLNSSGLYIAGYGSTFYGAPRAEMDHAPSAGYHYYAWLEANAAAGTVTYNSGAVGQATGNGTAGLLGEVDL